MYKELRVTIKSKLKTRNCKLAEGFTLVEMVVVMGIMALLMLLAATGFVGVRDQYLVDQSAEGILSEIRNAQSRSFATQNDGTDKTKAWGVKINGGSGTAPGFYQLISYKMNDAANLLGGLGINNTHPTVNEGVKIYPKFYANGTRGTYYTYPNGNYYVVYTAPFSKLYLYKYHLSTNPCSNPVNLTTTCHFKVSSKPTKEWELVPGTNPIVFSMFQNYPNGSLAFEISRKGKTARVILSPNGDAYIE